MMEKYSQKGITLIALVVTTVIILILAAVAVSMITGNDGDLFDKTMDARNSFVEASEKENTIIKNLLDKIDSGDNVAITSEKIDISIESSNKLKISIENRNAENIYECYINNQLVDTITEDTYIKSDLIPNTDYSIYVAITDKEGNTTYTNTLTGKTPARVYLYKEGDECTELTGGWSGIGIKDIKSSVGSSYTSAAPAVTKNATNIYAKFTRSNMSTGALCIGKAIDITQYKKLFVDISASSTSTVSAWSIISVTPNKNSYQQRAVSVQLSGAYAGIKKLDRGIIELDISDIENEMFCEILFCQSTGQSTLTSTVYLYNMWLE